MLRLSFPAAYFGQHRTEKGGSQWGGVGGAKAGEGGFAGPVKVLHLCLGLHNPCLFFSWCIS